VRRIPPGALQEREFRLFFTGQLVSLLGDAVTPFALAWAVPDLTGSARDLGFVIAAKAAPLVVFLLAGGVFAGRLPRRGALAAGATALRLKPRRPLLLASVAVVPDAAPAIVLALKLPWEALVVTALVTGLGNMLFSTLWETAPQQHVRPGVTLARQRL